MLLFETEATIYGVTHGFKQTHPLSLAVSPRSPIPACNSAPDQLRPLSRRQPRTHVGGDRDTPSAAEGSAALPNSADGARVCAPAAAPHVPARVQAPSLDGGRVAQPGPVRPP
jgi:hypothetical protein